MAGCTNPKCANYKKSPILVETPEEMAASEKAYADFIRREARFRRIDPIAADALPEEDKEGDDEERE